jgi:hypothetical protein
METVPLEHLITHNAMVWQRRNENPDISRKGAKLAKKIRIVISTEGRNLS